MKQIVKGSDIIATIRLTGIEVGNLTYLSIKVATDGLSVFEGSLLDGAIVPSEDIGVYLVMITGDSTKLMANGLLIFTVKYGLSNALFPDTVQDVVINGDFCSVLVDKYVE